MNRTLSRCLLCGGLGMATAALLLQDVEVPRHAARGVERAATRSVANLTRPGAASGDLDDDGLDRAVLLPSGAPTALDCDDARRIVAQARATLAAAPGAIDPVKFSEATVDWLDPHGIWSVATDAPPGAALRVAGSRLLAELEAAPGTGPCAAAIDLGGELARWSSQLRILFEEGQRSAGEGAPTGAATREPPGPAPALHARAIYAQARDDRDPPTARAQALEADLVAAFDAVSAAPFEDGEVTHSARDLARELGRQAGAALLAYGAPLAPYADAARDRVAPPLDAAGWSRVVIAAAVRSYVPQLDAHGAWAPLDEEMSIYDLALEVDPPERLWTEMARTALGVRIDRGALPPLADRDVVIRVHDVPLSGVSVEQAEQFAIVPDERPVRVTVLRPGAAAPLELVVASGTPVAPFEEGPAELEVARVGYADGAAAVIAIEEVPDDLGARLADAIERARRDGDLRGLVLDVRANGGGSTDGAVDALGLFLPGASLFPMRRRDGGVELESAPVLPEARRWTGPLAVLVDGDSASAAEMIAGAIAAYRRGVVIGERTYGKGCAQEYLDDDAHVGVLRLTTLLFSLPDGAPVQKVGIAPHIRLGLPDTAEREASVPHALGAWRGPDVREPARIREVPWPAHGGRVGPCTDETVCRALRALGATPAAAR